ncbi:hypothetical protein ACWKWU_12105 [Chitinophaga lutea]
MAIQFYDPETAALFTHPYALNADGSFGDPLPQRGGIPDSKALTGIEVRLLPPLIKDNSTTPFIVFPGRAKLYCLTIVVSDASNQLVGGIDLQGFPRIGDNEHLPINKTIYYWQQNAKSRKAPTQIHVFCSVVKSKAALRDTAGILQAVKDDDAYKSVLKTLAGATPAGAALDVITQIAGIAGRYLGDVEDKPVGTMLNSFTALRGDFDEEGVRKVGLQTRNVDFELELTVRDKTPKRSRSASDADDDEDEDVKVEMTAF